MTRFEKSEDIPSSRDVPEDRDKKVEQELKFEEYISQEGRRHHTEQELERLQKEAREIRESGILEDFKKKEVRTKKLEVISRRGFLKRTLLGVLITIGGAVLGGKSAYNVLSFTEEFNKTIEMFAGKKKDRSAGTLTEEERQTIKSEISVDAQAIAERSGFQVEIEVPSESGKWVIIIEQTHYRSDVSDEEKVDIIRSQKNIETLLKELQKSNLEIDTVFVEGIDEQDMMFNDVRRHIEGVRSIEPAPDCYTKLISAYEAFQKSALTKYTSDNTLVWILYAYQNKFQELSEILKGQSKLSDFDQAQAIFGEKSDDIYYFVGGPRKLYAEGAIDLKGAEEFTVYIKRDRALTELMETMNEDNITKTNVLLRGSKLADILKEKRESFSIINDTAEDVALKIAITLSPDRNIYPIVYGAAHDFKDNVERYNRDNPGKKIGLLRFSSAEN